MRFFDWLFGRKDPLPQEHTAVARVPAPARRAPVELQQPAPSRPPADGFPPARLTGELEARTQTPSDVKDWPWPLDWDTYLVPEAYRLFRRPVGTAVPAWGELVEITPTGKAAENFADTAIYDLLSDIEEFTRVGPPATKGDEGPYFSQDFELRRSGAKLSVVRKYDLGQALTIGSLPDAAVAAIQSAGVPLAKLGVEVVEARIMSALEKPRVRYSINLIDCRNAAPEPEEEDEIPPLRPSQGDLDAIVRNRSGEPLPEFAPGMTFYFGGGALKSMTLKAAAAMVTDRGGIAKSAPGPVSNTANRFMVAGAKPTKAVQSAQAMGIRIITEDEFRQMLGLAE